jgi:hypothetical protein
MGWLRKTRDEGEGETECAKLELASKPAPKRLPEANCVIHKNAEMGRWALACLRYRGHRLSIVYRPIRRNGTIDEDLSLFAERSLVVRTENNGREGRGDGRE